MVDNGRVEVVEEGGGTMRGLYSVKLTRGMEALHENSVG